MTTKTKNAIMKEIYETAFMGERGAMNISEIAKKANVSPATVSRVMNNTAFVKQETKDRVLSVIREEKYEPSALARSLSMKDSLNNIGFIIPDIDNPFFVTVLKNVTEIADQYHYNVVLFNTDENQDREHRYLATVHKQNMKGIIMIPLSGKDDETELYLNDLERNGIPVVLVDRQIGNKNFDGIFTDDVSDAFKAVETLIQVGHRKIATIAGPQRSSVGYERLLGYKQAMDRYGLEIKDAYIKLGDFKFMTAYRLVKEVMEQPEPPTALFTANNFATLAALRYFNETNRKIGEDISLIGFDEMDSWMEYLPMALSNQRISLVERPVKQIAVEAMKLLQGRMSRTDDSVKKKIVLTNEINLRGSELLTNNMH